MHDRPIPHRTHMPKYQKKKNVPPSQPPQRYNKICINMLTHEKKKRKRLDVCGMSSRGMPKRKRMWSTHGDARKTVKTKSTLYLYAREKKKCHGKRKRKTQNKKTTNVEIGKSERTCENEKKIKIKKFTHEMTRYTKKMQTATMPTNVTGIDALAGGVSGVPATAMPGGLQSASMASIELGKKRMRDSNDDLLMVPRLMHEVHFSFFVVGLR